MLDLTTPSNLFTVHWLEASLVVGILFTLLGYFIASKYVCKCNSRAGTLKHQKKQLLQDVAEADRFNEGIEHMIAELHKRK